MNDRNIIDFQDRAGLHRHFAPNTIDGPYHRVPDIQWMRGLIWCVAFIGLVVAASQFDLKAVEQVLKAIGSAL